MANTAFIAVNTAFGNIGEAPPNAQVLADLLVKDASNNVVFSQSQGCNAIVDVGDTQVTIAGKLTASARQVMNDPGMKVVIFP